MKRLIITISNNFSFDQRMQRIARSLSELFHVTVVGTDTRNPLPFESNDIELVRLKIRNTSGYRFYIEYQRKLRKYLNETHFEILYSVDLDTILAGAFAKKELWIFDAHEYFTEVPELQGRPFVKWVWKNIGRYTIPRTDVRITVNEELADIFRKKHNRFFHVIRNLPLSRGLHEESNNNFGSNILLYQGAVNKGRGLEIMLEIMKILPNYQLIIAGDGPIRKNLLEHSRKMGLTNVRFLGNLPPDKLKEWTQKAFLGLNLLESDSLNYYYSLANKFFDYTMYGVPSLNMNFPVYSRLNQEYEVSLLVDDLSIDPIIKQIRRAEDKTFYDKLVEQTNRASKEWTWEMEEKKLLEILSDYT